MYAYIIRRLIFGVITIIAVSILVFVVLRILPGDPLVAIFGADGFTKLTQAERDGYMKALGLSDPLWLQYLNWVKDILSGNFGRSFFRAESVAEMLARRGPLTAQIAIFSVLLSWIIGIPVALISALKPNSIADNVVRFLSILFLAVPGFWLGMLTILGMLFWFGYRPPLTFPGYWLYCGDNPTVHLIGDRQGEEGLPERKVGHTGLVDHIAFSCTGLAAMRAHLDKHKVTYTARVIPRDRQTQIFLHDPNGVAVELNYPPEETPPD